MVNTCKYSTTALTEVAQKLQSTLDEGHKTVNVFAMPARMPIVNQFALLFHTSLLETIDEYNLTLNDLRVILKVIELMQFGNLVKISWLDVGKALNIKKQNMSKHVRNLKASGLLITHEGATYLNPQIIAKGKFLQQRGQETEDLKHLLNAGAEALEGSSRSPSILTPELSKEIQRKKENEQYSLLTQA